MYILYVYIICIHNYYTYMYMNSISMYMNYNLDLTSQMAGRSSISIMNLSVSNIFTQRTEASFLYCSTGNTANRSVRNALV